MLKVPHAKKALFAARDITEYLHEQRQKIKAVETIVPQLHALGGPARPEFTTSINLGLDIRIPPSYIPEEHQRLRMYKLLGGIRSAAERESAAQELADRYGAIPRAVGNLLDYADLKLRAGALWIRSIERKKDARRA